MKWINAEQKVTVTIYDEEHEEHLDKKMTVEEMLDTYTNEGCPTIYTNPEQKTGKWTPVSEGLPEPWASVLITFSGKYGNLTADHAVGIGSLDGENGWYFEEIEGYTDRLTVEAWQPLPEPYKGSEG